MSDSTTYARVDAVLMPRRDCCPNSNTCAVARGGCNGAAPDTAGALNDPPPNDGADTQPPDELGTLTDTICRTRARPAAIDDAAMMYGYAGFAIDIGLFDAALNRLAVDA
jgi:hypothetical protein